MDLSVIIVNWNSVRYLADCIASIQEHTRDIQFEIIVVDNASPAGDAEIIEREFKNVILIKSPDNLGFAGANNLGFKRSSGKYVLFLNPDTKLLNPAINLMLESMPSLRNAGIVGCKLLNADLTVQTSSIQKFPTMLNQVLQSEYLRLRWPSFPLWGIGPLFEKGSVVAEVEAITGACMMMNREVFETVGLFSVDYFMYAEDLDLCYKVRRAGFKNYYVGAPTILHYAGKSSAPEWASIMKLQSSLRFCAKNRGRLYGFLFRITLALNAVVRLTLLAGFSLFKRNSLPTWAAEPVEGKWRILKALLTPSEERGGLTMADKGASQYQAKKA